MSEATIRARIKAVLEGVSGIGNVYDYERWTNNWDSFLGLFKTSENKIHGWTISRKATQAVMDTVSTVRAKHVFVLKGIYGLQDSAETEATFQALIESIRAALEADYTLAATAINCDPVQVKTVETRVFGTVLCHYAELELAAEEQSAI